MERRLQSLLDVAEEDKPDTKDTKPKDFSGLKELDKIGYVVGLISVLSSGAFREKKPLPLI